MKLKVPPSSLSLMFVDPAGTSTKGYCPKNMRTILSVVSLFYEYV